MKKTYRNHGLYRFLSLPKTILFGNGFYYQENGQGPYHLEVHVPSSNQSKRFIGWIGYIFLNPFAFVLKQLSSLIYQKQHADIEQTIQTQQLNWRTTKQALTDVAEKNKKYSYDTIIDAFDREEAKLNYRFKELQNKIKKPTDWNNEATQAEFNAIFQEAALYFPALLIAMSNLMDEENKLPSIDGLLDRKPLRRARRIVTQGPDDRFDPYIAFKRRDGSISDGDTPSDNTERPKSFLRYSIPINHIFAFRIGYSTFIAMYQLARSKLTPLLPLDKTMEKHENAPEFYDKENRSIQCHWRQLYNHNMKLFNRLAGKDHPEFRTHLTADFITEKTTRIDSSKNENFKLLKPNYRDTYLFDDRIETTRTNNFKLI